MGESTIAEGPRRSLGAGTMTEAFRLTVEDHGDRVAVRTKDDEVSLTWAQLRDRVDALAGGLAGLGVRRGDAVALMMGNRPEFHIADLAVMTLGGIPVLDLPDVHARADRLRGGGRRGEGRDRRGRPPGHLPGGTGRAARARDGHRPRADRGRGRRGLGRRRGRRPGLRPRAALARRGRRGHPHADLHVGHEGPPKGVQLVHRNIMATAAAADDVIRFPDGSKVISWLPAAHIAERNAHHYLPIVFGMTVTTCPNPREIVAYLPAVKPTWFFAVPRIFEKLKAGLEGHLSTQGEQTVGWLDRRPAQGRARAGRRARARRRRRHRGGGRRAAVLRAALDARARRGARRQRRRRPHAARRARLLPRHRDPAGRAVGHVGDLRRGRGQPWPGTDRHGRPALARGRASSPTTASCSCAATS